jgi:HlyD family secretion protein
MPESILTGTVNFISPFGKNERGVVTFDMTAILDPADIDLRGGLTATADIMITSRENVLLMPSKALIKSPMGTIALVVTPGIEGGTPTPVTTGASDYEYTEVISGLTEGQTVLIIDENQLNNSSSSGGPPRMGPPPGGGGGPMR